MCTEDASRLPKFPTCCHPPHAAILRPVHSAGPHPHRRPLCLIHSRPARATTAFVMLRRRSVTPTPPWRPACRCFTRRPCTRLHLLPGAHLGVPAARSSVYPRHRRFRRSPRASIPAQRYIIDLRSPPPNSYHVQYVAVVC
jgi:hypothetical protein